LKKDCNIQWKQYLRISTFVRGKKGKGGVNRRKERLEMRHHGEKLKLKKNETKKMIKKEKWKTEKMTVVGQTESGDK